MPVVIFLLFLVNALLLFATGQFLDSRPNLIRVLLGALIGSIFAVMSLYPGFSFLHHIHWHVCMLVIMSVATFGLSLKKLILFSLLHLSLGNLSGGERETISMLMGALGITFACTVIGKGSRYVPVELSYGSKKVTLTALRDTGNMLRDPITGKQVLIIGADKAQELTGLPSSALVDPVGSMDKLPGLRLIPYHTVGNSGFLLAISMDNVRIGNRRGNALVAFSPNTFERHYQALTGGNS